MKCTIFLNMVLNAVMILVLKKFFIAMMKQFQYVLLIVLAVIPEKASSGPVLEMKII